jgi:hypothetical protein
MRIKYSATSAKFHFLHETLRREKERVSPWWNLWAQFHMSWKLCETPIETQIEFHHATMQLNHIMRERLWDPWAYETVQWNYAFRENLFRTKVSHLGNQDGETLHWDWPKHNIYKWLELHEHSNQKCEYDSRCFLLINNCIAPRHFQVPLIISFRHHSFQLGYNLHIHHLADIMS